MKVELRMLPSEAMLQNHGLQEGGSVQKLVDNEIVRYMSAHIPRRRAGELEHMMVMATVTGSGQIGVPGPRANYLHKGVLYASPTTGSAWAKKNETKVLTDRELTCAGAPMRGKERFEQMKADHKNDILQAAQALINKGGKV